MYNSALAADRSQVIAAKTQTVYFCNSPGLEKVHVCAETVPQSVANIRHNVKSLEVLHQAVYLGQADLPVRKIEEPHAYAIWTEKVSLVR